MSLTITLPAELETKVTEAAARNGRQPLDYVMEALNNAVQANNGTKDKLEDWLDWDCIREAKAEADPNVTLEEVRKALSKIPGSMAEAINAEREERF
jgi:predicted transcriptional regulator